MSRDRDTKTEGQGSPAEGAPPPRTDTPDEGLRPDALNTENDE